MAITEALRLVIDADTRGAVQSIEAVGRTADRELSRSQKSLDRWGSRLTTVGAGLIAFGSAAAVGLTQAAQSAGDLEQAVGGSEAVFGDAAGTIERYGRTAADSAGLSETQFRQATTSIGGQLKRMGFDVDDAANKSIELTQVAADLAATYGGTTAEAVDALGAAFRGEADPAERFNLDLKVSKVNAEAVALGLADSTSAVDDHARAQALLSLVMKQSADAQGQFSRESDTLQGRQQRLAASFENLKADIGEGVIPAMQRLFGIAEGGIGAFKGLDEATGGMLGQIATIATVSAVGVGGLSLLVGQAIKMRSTLGDAASGVMNLVNGLRGLSGAQLGLAGIATAMVAIAGALELYNQAEQKANTRRLTDEFLAAGESVEAMEAVMRSAAKHGPTELIGVFGELASTNREAAERFIETAEAAGASDAVISAMKDHLDTTSAAEAQMAADTEQASGAMDEQAASTEEATSALQEYTEALRAQVDPIFAAMDAMTGIRDSQVAYEDALISVQEAQVALDEAIDEHGTKSAEAAEAQRNLEDAQRAVTDAQWAQVESAAEADAALAGLLDAVDRGDVSVGDFRATLQQWVDQGFLPAAEAADIAAFATGGLINKADDANRRRVNIPIGETGAGLTVARLDMVAKGADDVGARRPVVHTTTSGTDDARNRLAGVRDAANSIPASKTIWIEAKLRDLTFGWLSGARAQGGPVGAGRLYEVAEQGRAELLEMGGRTYLIPGSDGTVIPAGSWGGGAGGGAMYVDNRTVQYHIAGNDPVATIEAIKRYERMAGPGWRS